MFNSSCRDNIYPSNWNYFNFKQNKPKSGNNEKSNVAVKSGYWHKSSKMLNLSENNNSISSLKLNDKKWLIEEKNNLRVDSYYSPIHKERSNTIESFKDEALNKCKSSYSISSNEQASVVYQRKQKLNVPCNNAKTVSKKYEIIKTAKHHTSDLIGQNEERCDTLETSSATLTKNPLKYKGIQSIKNHLEIQKVREAILGTLEWRKTEFRSHENRKMKFL